VDIKPSNLISIPVSSVQRREWPPQASRDAFFYASSLSASAEIIDCVEIQSSSYQPAFSRQVPYPIRIDRTAQGKGTLIDVWI